VSISAESAVQHPFLGMNSRSLSFLRLFSTHKGCNIKCRWGSDGFFTPSHFHSSSGDESESTRFLDRNSNLVDCKFVEACIGD